MITTIAARLWCMTLAGVLAFATSPSSVTLSTAVNPSAYGNPLTITATVTSEATGKVTFYDGITILGTSTINGNQAVFTTALLPSGSRSLHAHYLGDTSFAPSDSAVVPQTVVGQPSLGLKPPLDYSLSFSGAAVAGIADFNGDGKPDIVAEVQAPGNLYTLLGNGDGTFQAPIPVVGPYWGPMGISDFNGDGKPDIAVGPNGTSGIKLFLGNGDGTFASPLSYSTGTAFVSQAMLVGDFNGDGAPDLALILNTGIGMFLGNGDGTFQPMTTIAGSFGTVLAIGDFNGDGKLDFAANANGTFAILLGNGDGTFQNPTTISTSVYSSLIAVGDFNHDGIADVAVQGSGSSVAVLLGNGSATFQPPVTYGGNLYTPNALAAQDVNGDGILDLVSASAYGPGISVMTGNGDGTFQAPVNYSTVSSATGLVIADFNGDGKADVASADYYTDKLELLFGGALPNLTISVSHGEGFMQGQAGAQYTLTVTNSGQVASVGLVTIQDSLPSGFTATAISGMGWTCVLATLTCTRSDALAIAASYPPITLTANISGSLTGPASDSATVSGGASPPTGPGTNTVQIRLAAPVSLTSTPNPSTLGHAVTLTATVPSAATGVVTFFDGITNLGTATVANGQASFTTKQLPSGSNNLIAVYNGDSTYGYGPSPAHAHAVAPVANNGLSSPSRYGVGLGGQYLLTGDFNGDTKVDLVVVSSVSATATLSVLMGNGDGTFQQAVTTPTPAPGAADLSGATAADFNRDGKLDLAISLPSGIYVLMGNGDGSFQTGVNIAQVGFGYGSITSGDLNSDGIPDLFSLGASTTIFIGNGDGTFQPPFTQTLSGFNYGTPVMADFNGDSTPDLASFGGTSIVAVLGEGNGTFGATIASAVSPNPMATVAGDFNGDGKVDLAVLSWIYGVSLYAGNGNGTFAAAVNSMLTTPASGYSAAAGDFNGDGKLDVAYRGYVSNTVMVALGNGDGTFQPGATFTTSGGVGDEILPEDFAIADFNGDGKPDFAVLNSGDAAPPGSSVDVFLGMQQSGLSINASNGPYLVSGQTGQYQITVSDMEFSRSAGTVTVTDTLPAGVTATAINGVGWTCVLNTLTCARSDALASPNSYPPITVTVTVSGSLTPSTIDNSVSISSALGSYAMADPTHIVLPSSVSLSATPVPSVLSRSVTLTATVPPSGTGRVLFLDEMSPVGFATVSSGHAQLVTTVLSSGFRSLRAVYSGDSNYAAPTSTALPATVLSRPSIGFGPLLTNATGSQPTGIAIADFNNDGKPDLATANDQGDSVSVLLGNGDGSFRSHLDTSIGSNAYALAAGDFNMDGKPDLAVASTQGDFVAVLLGNGDGTFQPPAELPAGVDPTSIAVGDFNGDGKEDLVVFNASSEAVWIYLGNGDGTFQTLGAQGASAYGPVQVTDLNGDGKADLVVGGVALLGNGDGTFSVSSNNRTFWGFTVGDLNGDGKVDLVLLTGSNLEVALGNGNGTFSTPQIVAPIAGMFYLEISDINGDGKPDIVGVSSESAIATVWPGNGDGTFQASVNYGTGSQGAGLAVADLNLDGRPDLAVPNGPAGLTVLLLQPTTGPVPSKAGIWRPNTYNMVAEDVDGNLAWDAPPDQANFFGATGDVVIFGDWNGTGHDCMGIFRSSVSMFALDMNCNGRWDPGIDRFGFFGQTGDVPIVGDWTGDGKSKIGIYRPATGLFALDANNNLAYDSGIDRTGRFGSGGDTPIIGDWTGSGVSKVGTFNDGLWWLDSNNDLIRDSGDGTGTIGQSGDTPVLGDWNGDGRKKVGIYRPSVGMFAEDYNGNLVWDSGTDRAGVLGPSGSIPVVGDWTGTGIARVGVVYGDSYWALDTNGNIVWDSGIHWGAFGNAGDTPVVGRW